MPVLVRNLMAGPTTLSDLDKIMLKWEGRGDPAGNDVQPVPDAVLETVEFANAVRNQYLEVVDPSEDTKAILARQVQALTAARQASAQAVEATIDRVANRDYITVPCIGPSPRGTGDCGLPVAVPEKKQDEFPPLCAQHAPLASQCVQIETEQMVEKNDALIPVKKWVRVSMTARETEIGA